MPKSYSNSEFQEGILAKLKNEQSRVFRNKSEKHNYIAIVLNGLKRELTSEKNNESIMDFIIQIIEASREMDPILLDKYILNILNIKYSNNLVKYITRFDKNVETALQVLKYKQKIIKEEDLLEFTHMNKEILKKNTKGVLRKNEDGYIAVDVLNELKRLYNRLKEQKDKERVISTEFKNYFQKVELKRNLTAAEITTSVLEAKELVWNKFEVYEENTMVSLILLELNENKLVSKDYSTRVFANKLLNLFYNALAFIEKCETYNAIACLMEIKKSGCLDAFVHELVGYVYFMNLKYKEAQHYIIEFKSGGLYFREIALFLDRIAAKPAPCSQITIRINMSQIKLNKHKMKLHKHLCYTRNTPNDILQKYTTVDETYVSKSISGRYNLLYFYLYQNDLFVLNCYDMSTILLYPAFDNFLGEFNEIFAQNRHILKTVKDKEIWWKKRNEINTALQKLLTKIKHPSLSLKSNTTKCYFMLEGVLSRIPFESIFYRSTTIREIYRILDIRDLASVHFDKCDLRSDSFYLIDPQNNLSRTRQVIQNYLSSTKIEGGVVGRALDENENDHLNRSKTFMYFGHGTGRKYYKIRTKSELQFVHLFGCSSVKTQSYYNALINRNQSEIGHNLFLDDIDLTKLVEFTNNGHLLTIYRHKLVVGCLWDVTDVDLDSFALRFLGSLEQSHSAPYDLNQHRQCCRMQFINGCAIVVYKS
ncbi:hypothetical protein ECANGB1_1977 [Enterospora canceri]|uniref:separase n=1 Tax=Enterospora canceri TaxID=1081671 RepID=A0A1Y1S594_9MICR|nr:hypothetical protein ECANGB1_1977 [Enterospora canceri]